MCRVLIKKTRPQCTTKTVNPHVRLTQTVPEQVPRRRSNDSEGATAARIEPKPCNNEHMAAGGRRRRSPTRATGAHPAPGYAYASTCTPSPQAGPACDSIRHIEPIK